MNDPEEPPLLVAEEGTELARVTYNIAMEARAVLNNLPYAEQAVQLCSLYTAQSLHHVRA